MQEEHASMGREKTRMRQMEQELAMLVDQAEELKEFNAKWDARMMEIQRRLSRTTERFEEQQDEDLEKHCENNRSKKPPLHVACQNQKLQQLRAQALHLAKLRKFGEADHIQKQADKHEAEQYYLWEVKCDNIAHSGGKPSFLQGQRIDKANFEEKIDREWVKLNNTRRTETEAILKRQNTRRTRFAARINRADTTSKSAVSERNTSKRWQ